MANNGVGALLSSADRNLIVTTNIICRHLKKNWPYFRKSADIVKKVIKGNWPETNENDHLPHLAETIKRDDKGLRNIAKKAGINYQELLYIYCKAVYKSDAHQKEVVIECSSK